MDRKQKQKFDSMMARILGSNRFYQAKYAPLGFSAEKPPTLDDLPSLPLTVKGELVSDQERRPPYGTNLTFPLSRYTRLHQTSGSTGHPLRWLDTAESWQWLIDCWKEIFEAAGVNAEDRIFVAFSFGPFIGFWGAFDAAQQLGALTLTGGGLSSAQRLETIIETTATVLISTPTYALRLAEVAREEGIDLAASSIRVSIHAGEPGASVPNVKRRIEEAWGARCVDHAGATEVGAWGYGCGVENHMHINEGEFIPEVLDPESEEPANPQNGGGEQGELVLTNLGRTGSPVIRYRTGDLVELVREGCPCSRSAAFLKGGVLGRTDQMLIIRGVNIYPSALENLVREFPQIDEFEVRVEEDREMTELLLRIEASSGKPEEVAADLERAVQRRFNVRPQVETAAMGTLPRYELKARRFKFGGTGSPKQ